MIEVSNITKSFGDAKVLDDVSFSIKPGMMTGFVGGNGAGKTTTMRILLGVLEADSGSITVNGEPITTAYRTGIGYMPEERGLYPKMRVDDQLHYLAKLHGVPQPEAKRRSTELLEQLQLDGTKTLEDLSLGNQQRAQVAAALIHNPVALILDEPFSGLDPHAVDLTVDVLRAAAENGAPVLFSSHQLDVVERLCDELVIISQGRIITTGTRQEIVEETTEPEWFIITDADTGWVRDAGFQGLTVTEFDGGYIRFASDQTTAHRVLAEAVTRGSIREFGPVRHSLQEIFRETVK